MVMYSIGCFSSHFCQCHISYSEVHVYQSCLYIDFSLILSSLMEAFLLHDRSLWSFSSAWGLAFGLRCPSHGTWCVMESCHWTISERLLRNNTIQCEVEHEVQLCRYEMKYFQHKNCWIILIWLTLWTFWRVLKWFRICNFPTYCA